MKNIIIKFILCLNIISLYSTTVYAHKDILDDKNGHYDLSDGTYHFETTISDTTNLTPQNQYTEDTDIKVYIDDKMINSLNYNGHMYVRVKDLNYYRFDVLFTKAKREVLITRNFDKKLIGTKINSKETKQILKSDIIVSLVDNNVKTLAQSINVDGHMYVKFEKLRRFGKISYDSDKRITKLVSKTK